MDGTALGTAAVVATMLIPVVSYIKARTWPSEIRYLVGLLAAFIAAFVGAVADGHVHNVKEFIPYLGTSFITAQTVYQMYFSKTELNAKLTDGGLGK